MPPEGEPTSSWPIGQPLQVVAFEHRWHEHTRVRRQPSHVAREQVRVHPPEPGQAHSGQAQHWPQAAPEWPEQVVPVDGNQQTRADVLKQMLEGFRRHVGANREHVGRRGRTGAVEQPQPLDLDPEAEAAVHAIVTQAERLSEVARQASVDELVDGRATVNDAC